MRLLKSPAQPRTLPHVQWTIVSPVRPHEPARNHQEMHAAVGNRPQWPLTPPWPRRQPSHNVRLLKSSAQPRTLPHVQWTIVSPVGPHEPAAEHRQMPVAVASRPLLASSTPDHVNNRLNNVQLHRRPACAFTRPWVQWSIVSAVGTYEPAAEHRQMHVAVGSRPSEGIARRQVRGEAAPWRRAMR